MSFKSKEFCQAMEEVSKFLAKIGSSYSIPIVENNHTKRLHGGVQKKAGTQAMCTGFSSKAKRRSRFALRQISARQEPVRLKKRPSARAAFRRTLEGREVFLPTRMSRAKTMGPVRNSTTERNLLHGLYNQLSAARVGRD